jgi:hypothetical protein
MLDLPALNVRSSIIEEAARFRGHPTFTQAVRTNAEQLLPIAEGHMLLNKLATEEARWLVGGLILFHHFSRDPDDPASGATLAKLQAHAKMLNLASPGRVGALVALMRLAGHVVQKTSRQDRRIKHLEPSDKMMAYVKPWLASHLEPIRLLDPSADFRDHMAHDGGFIGRFYRDVGTRFLAGERVLDMTPDIRLFMGRDAGYMILLRIWLADPDGAIPPRGCVCVPYEEVARPFGVSRTHVRVMMNEAAARGFVRLHAQAGRAIEVLPPLVDLFNESLSLQLANIAHSARVAASSARSSTQPPPAASSGSRPHPAISPAPTA